MMGRWRRHLVALGIATLAILMLFHRDVARLADVWWNSSTYGHSLLIGPIVGWLVWQRRREVSALVPVAWAPGLVLVATGGLAWLLGQAGTVAFARQLGLVMMVQGAVVTLLGPSVARGLAFPLGYALFLVPFGGWLEAPLQQVTVALVMPLLAIVGIPATSDGVMIHAGRYHFEVAEACSGAKFVVAMLAFGVLAAQVGFVSWRRRAAFLAFALIVPVLANGVRAFATIWAADLTSIAVATGFDHIIYGWVFFAIVVAGVLAVGWRWFDRDPDAPAFVPERLRMRVRGMGLPLATILVVAGAGVFPAWDASVAARAEASRAGGVLPVVPGWRMVGVGSRATAWAPSYPGADRLLIGRYARGADAVDVAVAVYDGQGEGREIVAFGVGVLREGDRWLRVADLPSIAGGSAMRIAAPGPVERVVATWYAIGGTVTAGERRVKIETARARLMGGDQRAVAVHVSAVVASGGDGPGAIRRFVTAAGGVERLARD
ncbi:MAG TPA: exosortase A [Sphingomonas sp.]|jgi:exosortase A|nr:exosortase A [Sphingomonas sp.]